MLDSYRNQGPVLATSGRRALCFGVPYDGAAAAPRRSCPSRLWC